MEVFPDFFLTRAQTFNKNAYFDVSAQGNHSVKKSSVSYFIEFGKFITVVDFKKSPQFPASECCSASVCNLQEFLSPF